MKEVLAYFVRHPHAADDLEGIARWRLLETAVRTRVAGDERRVRVAGRPGIHGKRADRRWNDSLQVERRRGDEIRAFLEADAAGADPEPRRRAF
jgi:hypothetical protein